MNAGSRILSEAFYTPELDAEIYASLTGPLPRLATLPPGLRADAASMPPRSARSSEMSAAERFASRVAASAEGRRPPFRGRRKRL